MLFKKRKISIRKYRKDSLKTYEPKRRLGLREGEAVSLLFRIGSLFLYLGGLISFFVSSLLIGVKGFFGIRKGTRRIFKGRQLNLERKKIYK